MWSNLLPMPISKPSGRPCSATLSDAERRPLPMLCRRENLLQSLNLNINAKPRPDLNE